MEETSLVSPRIVLLEDIGLRISATFSIGVSKALMLPDSALLAFHSDGSRNSQEQAALTLVYVENVREFSFPTIQAYLPLGCQAIQQTRYLLE